jgi:hypothetical protein
MQQVGRDAEGWDRITNVNGQSIKGLNQEPNKAVATSCVLPLQAMHWPNLSTLRDYRA